MNSWSHLPRGARTFLLDQPLPEGWKRQIEASLANNEAETDTSKVRLNHKRDYSMLIALVIMVISAFVLFSIAN